MRTTAVPAGWQNMDVFTKRNVIVDFSGPWNKTKPRVLLKTVQCCKARSIVYIVYRIYCHILFRLSLAFLLSSYRIHCIGQQLVLYLALLSCSLCTVNLHCYTIVLFRANKEGRKEGRKYIKGTHWWVARWRSGKVSDSWLRGRGFEPNQDGCRVITLSKLSTPAVLRPTQHSIPLG